MIELKNVTKKYKSFSALQDVTVTIPRGCITALIGPNASGKTTLIKSILGLITINTGEIRVNGQPIKNTVSYRNDIGYMPQFAGFPENLTVKEVIVLAKDLRENKQVLNEDLFGLFGLEKELEKQAKLLSGGTKQKLSAYITMLHNPAILILDEPTASLDPVSSTIIKETLRQQRLQGKTILMTSHNIHELEEVAEHIIFLLDGTICYQGTPDDLKNAVQESNLERAIAATIQQKRGIHVA